MNTELIPAIGYALYLTTIITTTFVVSYLILRHGRIFITQGFGGEESMAAASAGMMRTQFNLFAIAATLLLLRYNAPGSTLFLFPATPRTIPGLFEVLSVKIGAMLLIIGVMHFLALRRINRIRTTGEIF